jgi:hypothetical protein
MTVRTLVAVVVWFININKDCEFVFVSPQMYLATLTAVCQQGSGNFNFLIKPGFFSL